VSGPREVHSLTGLVRLAFPHTLNVEWGIMGDSEERLQMNREQIEAVIPHREPFIFLDSVLELVPGKRVVAEKWLTGDEDVFRGHFPGHPVFPGVLQIEAMAQAGAVAALSAPENQGKLALFAGIEKVRFRRQVRPGDTLRLEVELVRMRGNIGKGEGRASVEGERACDASLIFALTDRD